MADVLGKLEQWPSESGYLTTFSGGTRTQVKLDRPWQKEIELNPNCPLCTQLEKQKVVRTEDYAIEGKTPFYLPWTHEATVTHLLTRNDAVGAAEGRSE